MRRRAVGDGSGQGQIRLHKFTSIVQAQSGDILFHCNARGVFQLAVVEAECPVMPGTNSAAVVGESRCEARAGMGAGVIEHGDLVLVKKDSELEAVDLNVFSSVGG